MEPGSGMKTRMDAKNFHGRLDTTGPFPPGPLSANRLGLRTRDRGGSSSVNTGGRSSTPESRTPERWEKKPDS
jgi:hypothetical protein